MATRADSPLAAALDSVGDRWTLLLVEALLDAPRRFGDLQEELPGIAPNVLTQRLRRLEGGLLLAQPYSSGRSVSSTSSPPRPRARGSAEAAGGLGARHREGAEPPRHAACGSPVEARWWCPMCERPVDEDEAADLHFA